MPEPEDKKTEETVASVKTEDVTVDSPTEEGTDEEKKKSFFDDLEDAPKKGDEKEPDPAELKRELESKRMENEMLMDKLEKQNKARAEARRREKEARAELKKLQGETDPETKPEEDMEKVLDRKLYEKSVVEAIRGKTKYKEEAEMLFSYVTKLSAAGLGTGNAAEDVEKANLLLEHAKKGDSSESMPSPSSVSGTTVEPKGRIQKSVIEMGRALGVSREDIEKYGGSDEIVIEDIRNKLK